MRRAVLPSSAGMTRRKLVAGGALALAGCGRGGPKRLAVIPKADADLFFLTVHAGAAQAARDLNVAIDWNGPDRETDYSRQIQIVEVMITRHVDGMAISATDDRALAGPLERAIAAGIPVVVFDSAVNIQNYVSMVATDNHAAGCTAARLLAGLLPGGGKIAMVMQKPGGTSTELRERGFAETIAGEFPHLTIAAQQFGMGDRAKSMAVAENILTAHPDLAGIFASSEASSIGSIQAIRARHLSGRVKLITFDVSEIHVEALRDGTAGAMLVQDAFRIGFEAVKALAERVRGGTPVRRLDIPARTVLRSDLATPEIDALLHPQRAIGRN
jgi:ribose transport system substrate-binding protein